MGFTLVISLAFFVVGLWS